MARIRSADLAALPPDEKKKALAALTNPSQEEKARTRAVLQARVRQFETRYEMTSEEMIDGLARGEVRDTAEINQWMNLLFALSPNGRHPST